MSAKRAPSRAPVIDGFTHISFVGSGGFSDVFLYEQHKPRRKVAIKVLLADLLGPAALSQFDAEADLMAQLSTHPSIVTIYQTGTAADGRPYLAMEYCSRPSPGSRFRQQPFTVPEALQIGIQIAGAVETAHRAGILHRDIKPANILVKDYGRPALTDFGIASATGVDGPGEGLSIPWSPPESFDEPVRFGVATDVWALGATVYSLLAGRSPFEVPGGANTESDLIARIGRAALAPTGRPDVPASLERVLATAMAKAPEARYRTALALAREFQRVQGEMHLPVTSADEGTDSPIAHARSDDDERGTRVRVVSINPAPSQPAAASQPVEPPTASPVADTVGRPGVSPAGWQPAPAVPAVDTTVHRPEAASEPLPEAREQPARRRWPLWLAAGVLLVAGAGTAAALSGRGETPPSDPGETVVAVPQDPVGAIVPSPAGLEGALGDGEAVFTWSNPQPVEGDTYLWRVLDPLGEGSYTETSETFVSVPVAEDGRTCVEVVIRRSGRTSAEPSRVCVP